MDKGETQSAALFKSIQFVESDINRETGIVTLKCILHLNKEDDGGRPASPDSGHSEMNSPTDADFRPSFSETRQKFEGGVNKPLQSSFPVKPLPASITRLDGMQHEHAEMEKTPKRDRTMLVDFVDRNTVLHQSARRCGGDSDCPATSTKNDAFAKKYFPHHAKPFSSENPAIPDYLRTLSYPRVRGFSPEKLEISIPEPLVSPAESDGVPAVEFSYRSAPASPVPSVNQTPAISRETLPQDAEEGNAFLKTTIARLKSTKSDFQSVIGENAPGNDSIWLADVIAGLERVEKEAVAIDVDIHPECNQILVESHRTLQRIHALASELRLLEKNDDQSRMAYRDTMKADCSEMAGEFLAVLNSAHPWTPEMKENVRTMMEAVRHRLTSELANRLPVPLTEKAEMHDPGAAENWKNTLKRTATLPKEGTIGGSLARSSTARQTSRRNARGATILRPSHEPRDLNGRFFKPSIMKILRRVENIKAAFKSDRSNVAGTERKAIDRAEIDNVQQELIDFITRWRAAPPAQLLAAQISPSDLPEILNAFSNALIEITAPTTLALSAVR